MKASEIIKTECCGVGLSLCNPKSKVVNKVVLLESKVVILENQLENALAEIKRFKDEN